MHADIKLSSNPKAPSLSMGSETIPEKKNWRLREVKAVTGSHSKYLTMQSPEGLGEGEMNRWIGGAWERVVASGQELWRERALYPPRKELSFFAHCPVLPAQAGPGTPPGRTGPPHWSLQHRSPASPAKVKVAVKWNQSNSCPCSQPVQNRGPNQKEGKTLAYLGSETKGSLCLPTGGAHIMVARLLTLGHEGSCLLLRLKALDTPVEQYYPPGMAS